MRPHRPCPRSFRIRFNSWRFLALAAFGLLLDRATAAELPAEKSRRLVAVLWSDVSFFEKARACQQLGECGDRDAVAALAALLADEHLNAYARSGLEGIPDPRAAEALRQAAANLQGNRLAGVVNSLGVLRDARAVGLLRKLAADPGSGVVREAMLALGRIATDESIAFVREALAHGSETHRAEAAAACLMAAEQQWAGGHTNAAIALYDTVRQAGVPATYRAAATRGAIVARSADGIPLLLGQLRSQDPLLGQAALIAIREMPSDALASALNAELGRAPAALKIPLLLALADCHNAASLGVLRTQAASDSAEVRTIALRVLGQIGGVAEARVLLRALTDSRSPEESAVARNGLARMEGAAIDELILQALAAATEAAGRLPLIRLLEDRAAPSAARALLQQAADADARVSMAALRALKTLAAPGDLPALIALAKARQEEAVREAAANAIVGSCTRLGNAASGSDAVLAELQQATDPAARISWIRILVSLGRAPALPTLLAAVNDADESVAAETIEQLGRWPDPAPVESLLAVLQDRAKAGWRRRALASVIQLATVAADEHQRPDETVIGWFRRAGLAAQSPEERRAIVSGLGRIKHPESLRLLKPYLDDPGVQNEAAIAILQMAPAVRQADPAGLKQALERIAAAAPNPEMRQQAAKIAGTIPQPTPP